MAGSGLNRRKQLAKQLTMISKWQKGKKHLIGTFHNDTHLPYYNFISHIIPDMEKIGVPTVDLDSGHPLKGISFRVCFN